MLSKKLWLVVIAGSGAMSVCGSYYVSDAIAQIATIGQPTGNNTPLSQQALGEMQQNNSSVLSGSMNFFQLGGDKLTIPAIDGITNLLNWQSPQDNPNPTNTFSQTVQDFKLQQRQKLGVSNPILESAQPLSDQASVKQMLMKR
ncbi:hypothetical protein V2H45_02580 [Tumidithrix elongata RA019]|uniref:Uncharacterized protein n=1 Tax=Tumidithrix elongata BACA0141 TaxID=2716417 RepID=A0AAW9PYK9_9CYAN|nr:hypothetical protein [Tumidithrix elongata RA019]